ncbi:cobalamin biosynthesis protein CobG [Kitasatospora acidiphila]
MSPSLAAPEPARERAGRGRDDACPGALRLHAADDGALARIRVPGGLLTAEQALALATAAEELGDGALETTSRGNVQLRGLAADAGAELAARLTEAALLPSLSHDRVRNIVATPLAGLDGGTEGGIDLRPWIRELDALLCASDTARALSGRFLFALDDGRGDVAALDADVTLIARPDGSALLRLGRADWCAEAVDGPRAALRAAEEFVGLADGAWRVREADPDGTRLAARLGLTPRPLPELTGRRPVVGVQAGAIGVGLRFGRATADQWRALAGAASAAANELRVTPGAPSCCPVSPRAWHPGSPPGACAPTPARPGRAPPPAPAPPAAPSRSPMCAPTRPQRWRPPTSPVPCPSTGPAARAAAATPPAPGWTCSPPDRAAT